MINSKKFQKLMKISGIIIFGGFLVEILSFLWTHHLSFMVFLGLGCLAMGAGIVLFLYAVVSRKEA